MYLALQAMRWGLALLSCPAAQCALNGGAAAAAGGEGSAPALPGQDGNELRPHPWRPWGIFEGERVFYPAV